MHPPPIFNSSGHAENFPVASWLCPKHMRAPVLAIYRFARTADDIADEGTASAVARLAQLQHFRIALQDCANGRAVQADAWPAVFGPLQREMQNWSLPQQPFADLLTAFEQDVRMSDQQASYADYRELLDYCRHSANPIGRLLLHLHQMQEPAALLQSDAVCTALQLINFWQDLSVDIPRGRHYLPRSVCAKHGLPAGAPPAELGEQYPAAAATMMRDLLSRARTLMLDGAPLALRLGGRTGWELRATVQGGLRVLAKTQHLGARVFRERPELGALDIPVILLGMMRRPGR